MAGPSTSYRISQTVRAVTCRECLVKLDPGDLRVDSLRGGLVRASHHAECFVRNKSDNMVRIPEDLDGWDNLAPDLQSIVVGFKASSGALTSSQPASSNISQQSSSTPVRRTPSSHISQSPPTPSSQPVSVIVSRSISRGSNSSISQNNSQQLDNSPLPLSQLSRHNSSTSSIIDLTDVPDLTDGDDNYDSYDDSDDDDEESLPSQDPKRPRLDTDSQGRPVMPDLLAGVAIPEGPARTGDECSVCLDPPLHPVTLPCGHVFCYLCAKVRHLPV